MNTEYGNFINFVEPSPEDALKGIYAHLTTLKECPEELAEVIKDLNQQERQMIMTILKLVVLSQKGTLEIPNLQDVVKYNRVLSDNPKDANRLCVKLEKDGKEFDIKLREDKLIDLNAKLDNLENDDKKTSSFWEKFSKGFQNLFCYRISSQDIKDRIKQIKYFQ
jgi:hypothetical protein